MTEPLVWHYGLMAERWAEFLTDAPEVPFFKRSIERFGQPVLDVACGTGRVLIPLLRAGIDIDGVDISGDMLHYCRKKAEGEGYSPRLVQQPMHSFDVDRKYRTMYICGSFGLSGSRESDLETLRRCFEHLEPGGALLFNIQAEYTSPEDWNAWLPENRKALPEPWPEKGEPRVASDGSEHFAQFRVAELDPLEQTLVRQVRLEKWRGGELLASEEYTLRDNWYFKNEVLLMLRVAGFEDITVHGDYSDELATAEHRELIFTAVRK